jgi:hypothetical protein
MTTEQGVITPGLCAGELTLNGIELHSPAYDVTNVADLWTRPGRRWGNITVPGVPGDFAQPVRVAAAKYGMKMNVGGVRDWEGVHWRDNGLSSAYEGLERTIAYLEANVWEPAVPPAATIDGDVLMPSGAVRSAPCQVVAVDAKQAGGAPIMRVAFDLVVPRGSFVEGS